jgi:hypothetical protein
VGQAEPTHLGEHHIHQEQLKIGFAGQPKGLLGGSRLDHPVSDVFEYSGGGRAKHLLVIDEENRLRPVW